MLFHEGLITERLSERVKVPYKQMLLDSAKQFYLGNSEIKEASKMIKGSSSIGVLTQNQMADRQVAGSSLG